MNKKIKVELFVWFDDGLVKNTYFFADGRRAMDFAYSNTWNILKVYDEDGDLWHQNAQANFETYA